MSDESRHTAGLVKTKHTIMYCDSCEHETIRCNTCGNNCCNGGYGTVDGSPCPDCKDAHVIDKAYHEGLPIEFA